MLSATARPGVFYERLDSSAPRVGPVRTDVAGFVGLAERGPLDTPVPVQSWRQFESHYGGFGTSAFLPFAVRAFFENGGRRCWIVRVASRDASGGAAEASVTIRLRDPGGSEAGEAWRIRASSPGVWGNAVTVLLRETNGAQTMSIAAGTTAEAAHVASIERFDVGTFVRISQEGVPPVYRVVAMVDANTRHLFWVHPERDDRTRYDAPLTGFDLDKPIRIESVEYAIVVSEAGRLIATYRGLSLIPDHPRYAPVVLAAPKVIHPADLREQLPPTLEPIVIEELQMTFSERGRARLVDYPAPLFTGDERARPLAGGRDGLALLTTYDFAGDPFDPQSDEAPIGSGRGFRALDVVDEVTTIAIPDLHVRPILPPERAPEPPCLVDPCIPATQPPDVAVAVVIEPEQPPIFADDDIVRAQLDLVTHCEGRADRIALLDPLASSALDEGDGVAAIRELRRRFMSSYGVMYWPWIGVVDPLRRTPAIPIPPSGHAAGQFARADFAEGVHRAPANAPLAWAQDVTISVEDEVHGILNGDGINVVRALRGRGLRLMGARTLQPDGAFRYLNIRRLLMMVRASLYRATQWAAFEPNDWLTRTKLMLSISGFLLGLWRRGALAGAVAAEAFQVRCDDQNNPPEERDAGRLLAEVAIAPTYPLEFIVVRVGRTENEFEVRETGPGGGGAWR